MKGALRTLLKRVRRTGNKNKDGSYVESALPSVKQTFEECYVIEGNPLGKGSYGKVWKALRRSGNGTAAIPFAVKEIRKAFLDYTEIQQLKEEVNALAKLHHPNVISFFEKFETEQSLHIVMEYVSGGTLEHLLKHRGGLSEKLCRKFIYQIACALQHCKSKGIVHRDIKPGNILFTGDEDAPIIKLVDFGFSAIVDLKVNDMDEKRLDAWLGTTCYVSPEIVKKYTYNYKSDFWSLGVTMYEALTGNEKPFDFSVEIRGSKKTMFKNIQEGNYEFKPVELWENVSDDAKDLIQHLLEVDPDERYGPEETVNHPWLKDDESCKLLPGLEMADLFSSNKTSVASSSFKSKEGDAMAKFRGAMEFNKSLGTFQQYMSSERGTDSARETEAEGYIRHLKDSTANFNGSNEAFSQLDI